MTSKIEMLAEELSNLTSDQLWELSKLLVSDHKILANLLKSDLEFADQDQYFKD